MTTLRVWWLGFLDGVSNPPESDSMGMTYPDPDLNETYDRGRNFGEVLRYHRADEQEGN